jgi:peptidoglycan hydrolase-like protein with peptidoglycan-binding domain
MLTEKQLPYTGPYYGPSDPKGPNKGATPEALKRMLSRLGLFEPWTEFDQHYNAKLETAMKQFQRDNGITPASGQYGKGAWEAARKARVPQGRLNQGEYAMDRFGRWLIQNEAKQFADSSQEERVQEQISAFGELAIRNQAQIHYSQARPVTLSVNPTAGFTSDCSGIVVQAFYYARSKTSLNVPDPAMQNWTGYGNTDYYEDNWPKVPAPYRVGDLAHFHSERHVMFCIEPGDYRTAIWCSHGSEGGPERLTLAGYSRFPSEFLFVVRPPLVILDV